MFVQISISSVHSLICKAQINDADKTKFSLGPKEKITPLILFVHKKQSIKVTFLQCSVKVD